MKKILILLTTLSLFSCSKDKKKEAEPTGKSTQSTESTQSDAYWQNAVFDFNLGGTAYHKEFDYQVYDGSFQGCEIAGMSEDSDLVLLFLDTMDIGDHVKTRAQIWLPAFRPYYNMNAQVGQSSMMNRGFDIMMFANMFSMGFLLAGENDTLWCSNKQNDASFICSLQKSSGSSTITNIQEINTITDTIGTNRFSKLGFKTGNYKYGTWKVYRATGTFADTAEAKLKPPTGTNWIETDIFRPVTGSFTFDFAVMQD